MAEDATSINSVATTLSNGSGDGGGLSFKVQSTLSSSLDDLPKSISEMPGGLDIDIDSEEEDANLPEIEGVLSKWTNYITGWQGRFFTLKDGVLSYYKNAEDKMTFCRGTMDVSIANIVEHQVDHQRFEVSVSDQVYYLRAKSEEERQDWVDALEQTKHMAGGALGFGRKGSQLSLTSMGSNTSASVRIKSRSFHDKLEELKTYKDVLGKQIQTLQAQVLAVEQHLNNTTNGETTTATNKEAKEETPTSPSTTVSLTSEFKATALTFQATGNGLVEALDECVDMMNSREKEWKSKYERVSERYQKLKDYYAVAEETPKTPIHSAFGNPDMMEGPFSALNEEEFFDALEEGLDRLDAAQDMKDLRLNEPEEPLANIEAESHRLWDDVNEKLSESLQLIAEPVGDTWALALQDGELKVYFRRDDTDDDVSCDRLKAFHICPGVTAKEICQFFHDPQFRFEWENTIETLQIVEHLSPNSLIVHSLHKRVWPTAQRDSVLCCHIRKLDELTWVVQNFSVEHEKCPEKHVRIHANINFYAKTLIREGATPPYKREDISCQLTYLAYVNPGGWAPASVVRAVAQREYPKFLRTITAHSKKHYKTMDVSM